MRLTTLLFALLVGVFSLPAWALAPLKLGLLLDMAGPYADIGGQGTVTAAHGGRRLRRNVLGTR